MNIVQADLASLEEITRLFDAYRVFYEQTSDREEARQFINERLQHRESVIFLAMKGQHAVGFTQLYPTFSSVGMKKGYILNDLYVDDHYRGQGVGKALIDQVYQFCIERNVTFVRLETAPNNHKAKALYEKMGMELSNEYDSYVKRF
jgi:ribosomal protein S18 acetylase RimI-like enzyme